MSFRVPPRRRRPIPERSCVDFLDFWLRWRSPVTDLNQRVFLFCFFFRRGVVYSPMSSGSWCPNRTPLSCSLRCFVGTDRSNYHNRLCTPTLVQSATSPRRRGVRREGATSAAVPEEAPRQAAPGDPAAARARGKGARQQPVAQEEVGLRSALAEA